MCFIQGFKGLGQWAGNSTPPGAKAGGKEKPAGSVLVELILGLSWEEQRGAARGCWQGQSAFLKLQHPTYTHLCEKGNTCKRFRSSWFS